MAGTQSFYLKCESFQKMGAFKARGACNKLLKLESNVKNVCTHSSGNHAMAIAYMAKQLGLTAYLVIPQGASPLKLKSVEGYGGTIITSGTTLADREKACSEAC
jgi:threonine dehydratase